LQTNTVQTVFTGWMLKRQCHSMEGRLEFLLLGTDGCEASILKA